MCEDQKCSRPPVTTGYYQTTAHYNCCNCSLSHARIVTFSILQSGSSMTWDTTSGCFLRKGLYPAFLYPGVRLGFHKWAREVVRNSKTTSF